MAIKIRKNEPIDKAIRRFIRQAKRENGKITRNNSGRKSYGSSRTRRHNKKRGKMKGRRRTNIRKRKAKENKQKKKTTPEKNEGRGVESGYSSPSS